MEEKIAAIIRDGVTYAPQVQCVVIHGAIDDLVELIEVEKTKVLEDVWMKLVEAGYGLDQNILTIFHQAVKKVESDGTGT